MEKLKKYFKAIWNLETLSCTFAHSFTLKSLKMKKLFFEFAVTSFLAFTACNNKPAEEATTEETTVTEEAPVEETAAPVEEAMVDSAATEAAATTEAAK